MLLQQLEEQKKQKSEVSEQQRGQNFAQPQPSSTSSSSSTLGVAAEILEEHVLHVPPPSDGLPSERPVQRQPLPPSPFIDKFHSSSASPLTSAVAQTSGSESSMANTTASTTTMMLDSRNTTSVLNIASNGDPSVFSTSIQNPLLSNITSSRFL